ncbi:MAG TPA: formylglycine-generating enzyme family protein, partial [Motiliproteus sp.]
GTTLSPTDNPAFVPGAVFKDEILPDVFGPNMVVLPAGTYLMGDQDRQGDDNERPVHPVTIAAPFAMSQHEVTFADYDLFALSTGRALPSDDGWGRGDRPVINISWNDANAYTYWLRKQTGLSYRLPTEAEWEYAARAGSEGAFWWGPDIGKGNANCSQCGSRWDGEKTAPVGSFKPNPFGLYDLNGNVYEWVSDCYNDSYSQAPNDGSSWDVGQCNYRVMRGGSWYDIGRLARSASRYRHPADASRNSWGFRLALELH